MSSLRLTLVFVLNIHKLAPNLKRHSDPWILLHPSKTQIKLPMPGTSSFHAIAHLQDSIVRKYRRKSHHSILKI